MRDELSGLGTVTEGEEKKEARTRTASERNNNNNKNYNNEIQICKTEANLYGEFPVSGGSDHVALPVFDWAGCRGDFFFS